MQGMRRFWFRMTFFLVIIAVGFALLFPQIQSFFFANPVFNGVILGSLTIGILLSYRQVYLLAHDLNWIETFRLNPDVPAGRTYLITPLTNILTDRKQKLSHNVSVSIQERIFDRMHESRDISKYLIGLLIFLGLLGTFWGLLETVSSISVVIGDLSVSGADNINQVFDTLKAGLKAPLAGMGTAFSSSLFGLAGSLILGFLDLQSSQAQNRFAHEFENWIAGLTHIEAGTSPTETGPVIPGYIGGLLEKTSENLNKFQSIIQQLSEKQIDLTKELQQLTMKSSSLSEQMRSEQKLLLKLAENQLKLTPMVEKLSGSLERFVEESHVLNAEHQKSVDAAAIKICEEMRHCRSQTAEDIHDEVRLLIHSLLDPNAQNNSENQSGSSNAPDLGQLKPNGNDEDT